VSKPESRFVTEQPFFALAAVGLALLGSSIAIDSAEARGRRHHRHVTAKHQGYTPPYAAYVVDANTGKTLYAQNENELRHPASITKVMTLFMLFEQLEKGRMNLETDIRISAHAASMAPSKLGLRPGSTIEVEDAIKAVVTKSANDIASAIGESIGGTEDRFAEMMTAKALSLGMSRTHYANASGLPDPDQITTARDLSILGRAIQERFPRYYAYFATPHFAYRGQVMRNHNHLLGKVEGVDGIKTGYTRASGFNLLTSAKQGNRRIVSVVLGGKSARGRDQIMAGLIDRHLGSASNTRLASSIVETPQNERVEVARNEPVERREPVREAPATRVETPKPLAFVAPTAAAAALGPTNSLIQPVAYERPRPAVIASSARAAEDKVSSIPDRAQASRDGSTRIVTANLAATTTPGNMRWNAGPAGVATTRAAAIAPTVHPVEKARVAKAETTTIPKAEAPRPVSVHGGFVIQIGATDEASKATELLTRAKSKNPALAAATPFTEKVQKGAETLWRARFAGLSETQAETACKSLKRSGFACFATRN
jgi:D-alanyl-D-alanine carboxypeptidase